MTAAPHRPPAPGGELPATVTVHLQDASLTEDLSRLRSEVARSVLDGRRGVEVDVSGIDTISSPTVAAILWARRSCAARHVPFLVSGDAGRNARVLRSCGLMEPRTPTRW